MPSALVIGAGPAGCIAALMLARGGWDVTLVEQHRFPRDKVCGECLSALGYEVLERLGLTKTFHRLDPIRLTRTCIHPPGGRSLELNLPLPMWGVSRLKLDAWLLNITRDAGAKILQPARCENIDVPRDMGIRPMRKCSHGPEARLTVKLRDLITNEMHHVSPDWVLLADGKRTLLNHRPIPTTDLGLKAHFENIPGPRDAIELFGVHGHYGGIAPIEHDRWNIAFSVPRKRVQQARGNLGAMFAEIIQENPTLRLRLEHARRTSDWLASPLPRFAPSRKRWPTGVIPLGNAAASIEPVGGEGMGLAMRSAEFASEMLLSNRVNLSRLRRDFGKLWRMRGIGCRATALAVSQPTLARHVAQMKPLSKLMLMAIGKGTR